MVCYVTLFSVSRAILGSSLAPGTLPADGDERYWDNYEDANGRLTGRATSIPCVQNITRSYRAMANTKSG
jgi:hypothetical protein